MQIQKEPDLISEIKTVVNSSVNQYADLQPFNGEAPQYKVHDNTNDNITDLDKFLEINYLPIDAILKSAYLKDYKLSFKEEIDIFYSNLRGLEKQKNEALERFVKLFIGICLYLRGEYVESYYKLIEFTGIDHDEKMKFTRDFTSKLLGQIQKFVFKPKILVLISSLTDTTYKAEVDALEAIMKLDLSTVNFDCEKQHAHKFDNLDELISETFKYKYVIFVGHGSQYFNVNINGKLTELSVEMLINKYLPSVKRPKMLALLSCAHESYLPIAHAGLFQNFIISKNSNTENSEIFLQTFISALDKNQSIVNSFHISEIALMCRNSGFNQIELYRNNYDD